MAVCMDSQDAGPFAVKAFRPEPTTQSPGLPATALPPPPRTHVLAEATSRCSICAADTAAPPPAGPEPLPTAVQGPRRPPRGPSSLARERRSWLADPPAGRARPREGAQPRQRRPVCFRKLFALGTGPTCSRETPAGPPCRPPGPGLAPALAAALAQRFGLCRVAGEEPRPLQSPPHVATGVGCGRRCGPACPASWSQRTFAPGAPGPLGPRSTGEAESTPSVLWPAPSTLQPRCRASSGRRGVDAEGTAPQQRDVT